MKIGLTFDLRPEDGRTYVCGNDHGVEWDKMSTIRHLEAAITGLGHKTVLIGNIHHVLSDIETINVLDLVFNICEGVGAMSREGQVPAILDALGMPYTFADPLTMCMCLHKMITKRMLMQWGISTPTAVLAGSVEELNELHLPRFPIIVKPAHEGTSIGIDSGAVVYNQKELAARVDFILTTYRQCALIEEFITGKEITVGILGTGLDARVMGSAVINVKNTGLAVYGVYEKESCEELVTYEVTTPGEEVADLALNAYRIMGCRDAGRVDLITCNKGHPTVLEVNPLPGLHPSHSDLPIIAKGVGLGYDQMIENILLSASKRKRGIVNISDFHLRSVITDSKKGGSQNISS